MPNADTNSSIIINLIQQFVSKHSNSCLFSSLGQTMYFSCLTYVDAIVGNSSSGLLEAPSFNKATINIGDRQAGRLKASSVIDCEPNFYSIKKSIDTIYTDSFQDLVSKTSNPYGTGGSVELIIDTLKSIPIEGLLKKRFFDLT